MAWILIIIFGTTIIVKEVPTEVQCRYEGRIVVETSNNKAVYQCRPKTP